MEYSSCCTQLPVEGKGEKKILILVAMAASAKSESEFCVKVMNLASTGKEMDFLSHTVNPPQEMNTL